MAQRYMLVALVALLACAPVNGPVATTLRSRDLPLLRVDGEAVRGTSTQQVAAGSRDAKTDCRARVAEGLLRISDDGRQFSYRSTMRNCAGELLVTETNEGRVTGRDSSLTFVIDGGNGPMSFVGWFTDSTVVIYNLDGFLEFARPRRVLPLALATAP